MLAEALVDHLRATGQHDSWQGLLAVTLAAAVDDADGTDPAGLAALSRQLRLVMADLADTPARLQLVE